MHLNTPLLESLPLSRAAGRRVWLKLEALQPTGSFKLRGIGLACEHHLRQGARRLLCSSGGNAGLATAYAGRKLGLPVTVVVPTSTSQHAQNLLLQEGAQLRVHGSSWQEAHALALSLLGPQDAFIHPFDDPLLWDGHASMVDEVRASACPKPAGVVLAVGGGGLLCGVSLGLQRNGWGDVPLLAVETEGAASLHTALQAGRRVTLDAIDSIATSLGARQVCEQAFALAQTGQVRSSTVSDRSAVAACLRFLDDHRLLVEPACGAALALLYARAPVLEDLDSLLVIVCGGASSTAAMLHQWQQQFAASN